MHPKDRAKLALCNKTLKANGTKFYLGLISRLLDTHSDHAFLKPLSDAWRQRDFLKAFEEADSLSTQMYVGATEHFVANQFALLIKKYPWPKDLLDLKPRERAIASFNTSERRCTRVNSKFRLLSLDQSRDRFGVERGRARYWIRSVIGSAPNYTRILEKADFGKGASVGVHGDATSYSAKIIAERWSVSPGAIHHGYAALRKNYHLWESLLPRKGPYVCYDEVSSFEAYLSRIRVVETNKISFVPKTAKTDRTIAVEPMLNGLVQKGIDVEMKNRLLKVGINLKDQGPNQRFAREGSIEDSDDSFVTIDMKSASDSISTELVRYLIPDDWFRLLSRTRSVCYDLDGVVRRYSKYCSMGNGFCFPLETLIFAAACSSVGCGVPSLDFVVYGDDIIVRKRYAASVLELLKYWGFKINLEKTFLEGPFRESCGADWFGGEDVRPFTLDYALDSLENVFKYLNLTRRSERCESFFRAVRGSVINIIPEQFRFFRPFSGEENTGIDSTGDEFMYASSCQYVPTSGKWRWHELSFRSYVDFGTMDGAKDQPWLISTALRGASSIGFGRYSGLPEVTLRNRTQMKIVRKGYVSTSNWLPTPSK